MLESITKRGLLISDFNIDNLAAYLNNDPEQPLVKCSVAPFAQISQALLDRTLPCWEPVPNFIVVWSRPEGVLEGFCHLAADGEPLPARVLRRDVDEYCKKINTASAAVETIFVPIWTIPAIHMGQGRFDLAREIGVSRCLLEANLRLLEKLDKIPNVVPLCTSKWIELAGDQAFNDRSWYMGKIPFGNSVFKGAAREIKGALNNVCGAARKLIIVDLDDTLWSDIVGDVGWQNIILGGHDPIGEALVDFQKGLKALARRGLLLGIASKNEEAVALEAISKHPEMVLRQNDFVAWRINWKDKVENILDIVAEVNLGLQSVVFIDDNRVERDRVRQALPEVFVPDWPADKRLYPAALNRLDCFQQTVLTDEDRHRTEMYSQERTRIQLKSQVATVEEWLRTLELTLTVTPLGSTNVSRATQLLNKTNQMNLSTRRMTEQELNKWSLQRGHRSFVFDVSDRFGDSGLTGILSLKKEGERARIVDFVLSCRVMGRKIEEAMLHVAVEWCRCEDLLEVFATYSRTAKNAPCLAFLKTSRFRQQREAEFEWDTSISYPLSPAIRLLYPEMKGKLPTQDPNVQR